MSTPSTSFTVLGLGNMGEALDQAFLKAEYKTTVWNRSPEKAKDLVANGAHLAKTVAESFEASDLIVVCLLDNKGAKYIHGGIMSEPQLIGTQASLTIYSGDSDIFNSVQKDLTALGTSRYIGADLGVASLYDLALLSGMYGLVAGFTQAASLVQAHKVQNDKDASLDDFVRTLLIPLLVQLFDYFFVTKGKQLDDKVYASKGDLMRPVQRLFQAAVAGGYADGDITAFVNLTRETE
ncbi:hypothetical protein BGZ92_005170 [Podila epicladia]|nr:hypothetical protein BGZ92_005170 [Podila epicladia]